MTEEEIQVEQRAFEYVKSHAKDLVARFAPSETCHRVDNPVSLFMAGSPGAGKTEVSKGFLKRFEDAPIRIDADDIRPLCPGYIGTNAHLFQKAANKAVNILYDHALHNGINCIVDGTFAYAGAADNIARSVRHRRRIQLWFVYQDPIKAWEFTKARERKEARHVSKEVFIKAFMDSRYNARMVKEQFGEDIELNLLTKDYVDGQEDIRLNITATELDQGTDGVYSEEELRRLLI